MVSSLELGYIPSRWLGPNILESEGIAMLHRRRAPLFAGLTALSVACALSGGSALAQTTPAPITQGQPFGAASPAASPLPSSAPTANTAADAFAVSGVKVDITAANANSARDSAIREAQSRAWTELYKRLVPTGGAAPKLPETELAKLVQGFEIDEEKVSATQYVGSITVRFRPNAVRDVIGGSVTGNSQYVEPPAKPFVVLPVTMTAGRALLWEDRTPWRAAWEERPAASSLVPLVVPDGELADAQAIGTEEAIAGNPEALARIAQRYHAGGVIVARVELPGGGADPARGLSVDLTRYGLDGTRDAQTVSVKPDAAAGDVLTRAVATVGAQLDEAWRRDNVMASGPEQSTLVRVPLAAAADWVEVRKRLTGFAAVTRTDLQSMTRSAALVTLTHRGDPDRLAQALAKRDLSLTRAPSSTSPSAPPSVPGAVSTDWQLTLLPRSGGEAMAAPLGAPSALAPTAPLGGASAPSGGLGAPPRDLGTLPAKSVQ